MSQIAPARAPTAVIAVSSTTDRSFDRSCVERRTSPSRSTERRTWSRDCWRSATRSCIVPSTSLNADASCPISSGLRTSSVVPAPPCAIAAAASLMSCSGRVMIRASVHATAPPSTSATTKTTHNAVARCDARPSAAARPSYATTARRLAGTPWTTAPATATTSRPPGKRAERIGPSTRNAGRNAEVIAGSFDATATPSTRTKTRPPCAGSSSTNERSSQNPPTRLPDGPFWVVTTTSVVTAHAGAESFNSCLRSGVFAPGRNAGSEANPPSTAPPAARTPRMSSESLAERAKRRAPGSSVNAPDAAGVARRAAAVRTRSEARACHDR